MRARRREQQPGAPRLEDLTDRELVRIRFFGKIVGYQISPDERLRAYEILKARGYYRWDPERGGWYPRSQTDPEAA